MKRWDLFACLVLAFTASTAAETPSENSFSAAAESGTAAAEENSNLQDLNNTAFSFESEAEAKKQSAISRLNEAALYGVADNVHVYRDDLFEDAGWYVGATQPDISHIDAYGRDVMQELGLHEPLDAVNRAINATKDDGRRLEYSMRAQSMKSMGRDTAQDWMGFFGEIYRDNIRAAYKEGLEAGGEEEAVSNGDLLADQFASARRLGRAVTEKKKREAREAEKKAREEEEARIRSEEEYKERKLNNTILTVSLSVIGVIVGAYPLFLLCKASRRWNYEQWAAALAVVLLGLAVFAAVFPWWLRLPYGFYLFLRVIVAVLAAWQAARSLIEKRHPLLFLLPACLCLIYQPLVKIPFERETWLWLNAASVFVLIIGARRKKDNAENDA
ncbi:MAG: hypothetical protein LIO63_06970 [Akkermansia sp.]|nr:hypothetical protein [Akkermansia sp.]